MLKCSGLRWNTLFQFFGSDGFPVIVCLFFFLRVKVEAISHVDIKCLKSSRENCYKKIAGFTIPATKVVVHSLKYTALRIWVNNSIVIKRLLTVRMTPTGSHLWRLGLQGVELSESFRRIRECDLVGGSVSPEVGSWDFISPCQAQSLHSPLSSFCLWIRM